MELRSQLHAPAALPTEKQPQVPTEYEVGWAPSQYGRFGQQNNLSPLSEIKPQFFSCPGNSLAHTATL